MGDIIFPKSNPNLNEIKFGYFNNFGDVKVIVKKI